MKVCKKCKTHVANKAKICKNCGADVSKAPIIKSNSQKSVKKTNTPVTAKKNDTVKSVKKKDSVSKIDKTDKVKKNTKFNISTESIKQIETHVVEKPIQEKKNILKEKGKLVSDKIKKIKKVHFDKQTMAGVLNKILLNIKQGLKILFIAIYKVLKFIVIEIYIVLKNTGLVFLEWFMALRSFLMAIPPKVKKFVIFIRNKSEYLYKKYKTRATVRKNERLAKKRIKEEERIKRLNELEEEKRLKEEKNSEEKIELEKIDYIKDSESSKQKRFYQKRVFKVLFILFIIISLIIGGLVFFKKMYEDLTGKPVTMVSSKKASKNVVFNMNDVISYKNVDYKIVKIETSDGNAYKQPKKGNQFLIVTVYIKNHNKKKVPYSYVNWTMSNSKNEEKNRIFTSINVDTALYSGELVVGGVKTGSMVFEQPINDPKLKMNFYELKKDEEGYDIIDTSKRAFSISVKYPKTVAKEEDKFKDSKIEHKIEQPKNDKKDNENVNEGKS